jgi:hypothetical protein
MFYESSVFSHFCNLGGLRVSALFPASSPDRWWYNAVANPDKATGFLTFLADNCANSRESVHL